MGISEGKITLYTVAAGGEWARAVQYCLGMHLHHDGHPKDGMNTHCNWQTDRASACHNCCD
jgi:hypothetical protein